MSVEEIKALVDSASEEERIIMAAYLRIKTAGGEGPLGVALAEANERVSKGQYIDLDAAKKLHADMERMGL
jgi:hypothetical protein